MLENLISNAVKYSPPGKNIFVRLKREPSAVRIEVQESRPQSSPVPKSPTQVIPQEFLLTRSNPGAILPGVVGAIALILALYMSAILPVNTAGLALMGFAVALFIVDVFTPTHGVLTAGGIGSFFLGSLMVFDRNDAAFQLSLAYVILATVLTAAFFIFIVGAGWRAQFQPVQSGREAMLGKTPGALSRIDAGGGKVFIEGEHWNAVSDTPVEAGQTVEVIGIEGLTLKVKPKNQ